MNIKQIYLDHSATTPVDERVFAEMKPYFSDFYGNPSSLHRYGQKAEAAVENARMRVAKIFSCAPESIFFTACATESNNIVLKGLASRKASQGEPYQVLTTPVEHPSVLGPLRSLEERDQGTHSFLPVDHAGKLQFRKFEELINNEISLVSIIFGNNEIGTINPIRQVGESLANHPTLFHTDAVQCANFIELNVNQLQVDFLTLSAHKFYGPKGVGILYARDPASIEPLMHGGSQEHSLRPGTHNVPLIIGAVKALELAQSNYEAEAKRLVPLRDAIISKVLAQISDCELTGDPQDRLPHHISFAFEDVDSNQLLAALDMNGYACSSGSACKVGNPEPSGVLLALGFSDQFARGALRVTLGHSSAEDDCDAFVHTLVEVIERLRTGSR